MNERIFFSDQLRQELLDRLPSQRKTQRVALSSLVAAMLEARSANTAVLSAVLSAALPRDAARSDMRLQWVSRFLSNPRVKPWEVMAPFSLEAIENARENGEPLTVMIDQSKVGDGFETLMLALRFSDRALPLLWLVKQTKRTLGFTEQKPLLDALAPLIPDGTEVRLMGDRF